MNIYEMENRWKELKESGVVQGDDPSTWKSGEVGRESTPLNDEPRRRINGVGVSRTGSRQHYHRPE